MDKRGAEKDDRENAMKDDPQPQTQLQSELVIQVIALSNQGRELTCRSAAVVLEIPIKLSKVKQ